MKVRIVLKKSLSIVSALAVVLGSVSVEELWVKQVYAANYSDTVKVGDIITFGSYEQDNNIANGKEDIEWEVLAKENNRILVISKYILDNRRYLDANKDYAVTWEDCSLRKWLNNGFFNEAFNSKERSAIQTVTIKYKSLYGEPTDNSTRDKVFLLDKPEAETYFKTDQERMCALSDYVLALGAGTNSNCMVGDKYSGGWWLRSLNGYDHRSALGTVCGGGIFAWCVSSYRGVRPAMWINLSYISQDFIYAKNMKIKVSDVIGDNTLVNYIKTVRSTDYNPKLSYLLAGLSWAAYDKENIEKSLSSLGFEDKKPFCYPSKYKKPAHYIAKKTMSDGTTLVMVVIRGTEGTGGSADLGTDLTLADTTIIGGKHRGFRDASDYVYDDLKSYLGGIPKNNVTYVITGHSLGGATANLLSLRLTDEGVPNSKVFNYNFGCPDVAKVPNMDFNRFGSHDNMFNIANARDPISVAPGVLVNNNLIQQWGKFGRSYWFSDDWKNLDKITIDFSFKSHYEPQAYLNYLSKERNISDFKSWSEMQSARTTACLETIRKEVELMIHHIACPVDVYVYNNKGELVASVVNNQPQYHKNVFGEVLLFVEGDQKTVCLSSSGKYEIELRGTATGKMNYTVDKVNLNTEKVLEEKKYNNVALTKNKKMETVSDAGKSLKKTNLYVLDKKNNIVADVNEKGKEKKVTVKRNMKDANVTLAKTSYPYSGKAITPGVTVKIGRLTLKKGTDYSISYKNNKKIGTATATITGKGKVQGTKKVSFKITGADNPLKVSGKTATIKSKNLKKKSQTLAVNKVIKTVKKGQGKVTYVKVSGDRRISINKTNGKVTVKKGIPVGTYPVTVNVTVAGKGGFNKGTRSVTFTIKVL